MSLTKYEFLEHDLEELRDSGLLINLRTIESAQGAWIQVDGKRVLNFCSNNYLDLANHPKMKEAAEEAIASHGVGPAAVRSIAGTLNLHTELENRLAEFKNVEAVIALQSGFLANQAVIPTIMSKGDLIISDELNHASIIDGVRLCKADRAIYSHCNMDDLKARLDEAAEKGYQKILIITDGVFSMDGDIAPLDKLVQVSDPYNALIMVDDAHGEGVLGKGGRGIVDHFGVHGKVDIEVGTLSKAFGVVGGFVAGKKIIIDYLRQRSRPFLFSSATTPADTAACIAGVELLEESTDQVHKLWENRAYFVNRMNSLGFDTGLSETPIVPVMLGDASLAQEVSKKLFDNDIFGMAIAFPTVAHGKARIRVMISAAHSKEDLDFGISAFVKVGKELGVI